MSHPAGSTVMVRPAVKQSQGLSLQAQVIVVFVCLVSLATVHRQQTVVWLEKLLQQIESQTENQMVSGGQSVPVVAPKQVVRLDFVPPSYLEGDQLENLDLAIRVAKDPAAAGLSDKSPVVLDHNGWELLRSLWQFENQYRHVDTAGEVAYSYNGCCVGFGQVNLNTSVCEEWELFVKERNMWCAAKIFEGYYNTWAKAGPRHYEVTVAMYKNAVVMKEDLSDFVPGPDGLPVIGPDDPADPMDFASQVGTVFIDPMTGASRFAFAVEN